MQVNQEDTDSVCHVNCIGVAHHVEVKGEGSHVQAEEKASEETRPADTVILTYSFQEL